MQRRFVSLVGLTALLLLISFTAALPSTSGPDSDSDSDDTGIEVEVEIETCYNLDGSVATGHVPCSSHGTTNCCHSSDICLSDGLCYMQGSHGLGLSRGTCTDEDWGPKCHAPCSDISRGSSTLPIVPLHQNGNETEYCCSSVTTSDGEAVCSNGRASFTLDPGTALRGVAGLSEESEDESDDDNEEEEEEEDDEPDKPSLGLAIGVGVGVPLGLIGVAGILWAVWERRRRDLQIAGEETGVKGVSLTSLQHRYGPIPDPYSGRGTPVPIDLREVEPAHAHDSMETIAVLHRPGSP